MRADAGGRALVLPCPTCPTRWSTEQTLAGHLIDDHELDPPAAVQRALETSAQMRRGRAIQAGQQRAQEETTEMANETYTCHTCGGKGHNARSPECPKKDATAKSPPGKRCNYCHHPGHTYAECPKVAARRAGKKCKPGTRKDPKAAASPNGFAGALQALRAERTELDAAIAALERLEARGR